MGKSTVHLLVLPRVRILSMRDVGYKDLPMLRSLADYLAWMLQGLEQQFPDLRFTHGLHSVPSLRQLHIHVLSRDFLSPCMKNAKHFNSFQNPFFVPLGAVIDTLHLGVDLC